MRELLETSPTTAGVYRSIVDNQPNLFAGVAGVSGAPGSGAHERRHRRGRGGGGDGRRSAPGPSTWRRRSRARDHGPRGVFLGYDFHLGPRRRRSSSRSTPTPAAALLNAALGARAAACCDEVEAAVARRRRRGDVEARFLAMFRAEWRRQRGAAPLRRIAIVDGEPAGAVPVPRVPALPAALPRAPARRRHRRPARRSTTRDGRLIARGRTASISSTTASPTSCSPATDCAALRAAYEAGDVVVTPNPHPYALYADKRHLTVLSDAARLRAWGVDEPSIALLAAGVPRDPPGRRRGRRRAVGGAPPVFLQAGGRLRQQGRVPRRQAHARHLGRRSSRGPTSRSGSCRPSERTIAVDGCEQPLKLDLRAYVYDGAVQLVAARLYQGQTTNFRTAGGGFAPVFTAVA